MTWTVLEGDCRDLLRTLPEESVQCCVTSPPYWGLRDYGVEGQLGLERTPEEYVAAMVEVFRDVRRVLRPDGMLWLNLGDSYSGGGGFSPDAPSNREGRSKQTTQGSRLYKGRAPAPGLKPKDLCGIPWRVALALQADGWWLRMDVVWAKPNPMPESVTDRPTRAHEYVFLLSRSPSYFYDADAIREEWADDRAGFSGSMRSKYEGRIERQDGGLVAAPMVPGRNVRSVWTISTKPFSGAHFAVMPWDLAERCVLAGSRPGDEILDPFAGAGTVGMVARRHGRSFVGIELSPLYARMARERIVADMPLFNAAGGTPP